MKDRTTEIFENAPIPKAVFSNIIPAIISMLMVLVYNLADTYFISQTENPYMVAAVSYATPAFLLFMAIGMLFGIGGTSLISRMLGEGKREKAKHTSSFCFWTGITVGVIGMLVIWIFIRPICRIVGSTEDTVGYVREYLQIVAYGKIGVVSVLERCTSAENILPSPKKRIEKPGVAWRDGCRQYGLCRLT